MLQVRHRVGLEGVVSDCVVMDACFFSPEVSDTPRLRSAPRLGNSQTRSSASAPSTDSEGTGSEKPLLKNSTSLSKKILRKKKVVPLLYQGNDY